MSAPLRGFWALHHPAFAVLVSAVAGAGPSPRPTPRLAPASAVAMDSAALTVVDSVIVAAIRDGATPGAALAVGRHGRLVRLEGRFARPGRNGRGLGWDIAGDEPGAAGSLWSPRTFGHTGFTGTSLWIDPDRDLFVVLLTNRVDPTAANHKHIALRQAVHDAVANALTDAPLVRSGGR